MKDWGEHPGDELYLTYGLKNRTASPDGTGIWLFRQNKDVPWQLCHVFDGKAHAGWIGGQGWCFISHMSGFWKRPTNEEIWRAKQDDEQMVRDSILENELPGLYWQIYVDGRV